MRVIGVRRSCPAAATSRMRLSMARFRRDESELSALAVALTSAGPRSGKIGNAPSGPTDSTAFSSSASGLTMRLATNTAIAVAPIVMSRSHLISPRQGAPWGGKSVIGNSTQPRVPTGIETTSGARHPSRDTVTARSSPRAVSASRSLLVTPSQTRPGDGCGTIGTAALPSSTTRTSISTCCATGTSECTRLGGPSR